MADNQTEFWRRVLNPPDPVIGNSLVEFSQDGVDPIGALIFPIGTTAQRPSSAVNGMMRYNTTLGDFEFFNGTWQIISGVGGINLSQLADADADTQVFTENSPGGGVDDDIVSMTIGDNSGTFTLPTRILSFSTAGFTIETPAGASGGTPGVDFGVTTGAGNLAGRGGDISLTGGIGGTTGDGGDIVLTAGGGGVSGGGLSGTIDLTAGSGGTAVPGGAITLTGGDGNANVGGAVNIQGGTVSTGTGAGGAINITAGASGGSSVGGAITLTAGTGSESTGGAVSIFAGAGIVGGSNGGQFFVAAGDGNSSGAGGNVSISAGDGGASGLGGDVIIATGTGVSVPGSMTFNLAGTEGFTLEADGTLSVPVLTAGGAAYETQVTDDDDIPNKAYVDGVVGSLNNVVDDLTPQLGGTLDLNDQDINETGKLDWDSVNNLLSVGTEVHTITFGTVARGGIFNSVHDDANNIFNYLAGAHTNTANLGPLFQGYRSRGTEGAPTIVADGDELVELSGGGFDGVDFESAGKINLIVNGTPGSDDMPGAWVFFTTPDGGTAPVEHFRIEQDGTLNVAGTSAYEALVTDDDDIPNRKFVFDNFAGKQTKWIPASEMIPTTTAGSAVLAQVELTAGQPELVVLDFDASADEHAQFSFAFPKSWNESTVSFQVFWTSAGAVTTGVAWALQAVALADGDPTQTAYGSAVVITDNAQAVANDTYVSAESSAITVAGTPGENELVYFRIFRDISDGADNMTQDARLIGIKLFFTTDAGNDA